MIAFGRQIVQKLRQQRRSFGAGNSDSAFFSSEWEVM
jgi:hypothetical protein